MATAKDKKIFAFNNFRGLDKENKPLKVAPFRASDGYNFIIDSDTLKTRPAFEAHTFVAQPGTPSNLIDYYTYRDFQVFITETGIFFKRLEVLYPHTSANIISSLLPTTLPLLGKRPIFKEEKEALFIFGLDHIYVVSFVGGKIVLYDINNKPSNPFTAPEDDYYFFEDLPTPYVPTIFIGDNAYEQLNNLSNSYKYDLFAEANAFESEGLNTYYLPTHYEQDKHTNYSYQVEFYKNVYGEDIEVVPFFLGIDEETFDYDSNTHGTIINPSAPIIIKDTFFPTRDFEFVGTPSTIDSTIYNKTGLTKKDFFALNVLNINTTTFEYILDYVKTNTLTWTTGTNKILLFTMPIEYNAIYRDPTTNNITQQVRERTTVTVYAQLRKYELQSRGLSNKAATLSFQTTDDVNATWINFPITLDGTRDIEVQNTTAIQVTSTTLTSSKALEIGTNFLLQQDLTSATDAIYNFRMEYNTSAFTPTNIFYNTYICNPSYAQAQSYPAYNANDFPTLPIQSGELTYDAGSFSVYTGQISLGAFSNAETEARTRALNWINGNGSIANGTNGVVWTRIYVVFIDYSKIYSPYIYTGIYLAYKFTFTKQQTITTYYRAAVSYTADIFSNSTEVINGLYDLFEAPNNSGLFEFKVKDYFIDIRNEPAIKVTITHQDNPDYDLIAKNTFGVSFGSENRLFLAGHPDYPNIDRYNVSNDLLGVNDANQSYELSYFPSKNYRVVGGKGPINGYVVATDTQLYVTKADYPNDEKLFIRERILDENGVVGYREFKTNINKTPLNDRCIVRFFNDIVMLAKDGLYAIEISSNVLTNERLLKLRSGFINKELINAIKTNYTSVPFILENNYYMYIIINNIAYVADSRYVAVNENGIIDNQSYEIVKWNLNNSYKYGKVIDGVFYFIDSERSYIYKTVEDANADQLYTKIVSGSHTLISDYGHTFTTSLNDLFYANPQKFSFKFSEGERLLGNRSPLNNSSAEFNYIDNTIIVTDPDAFIGITDGDTIILIDQVTDPSFIVEGFEASGRTQIVLPASYTETPAQIRVPVSQDTYYIIDKWIYSGAKYFAMTYYKPTTVNDLGTLATQLPTSKQTYKYIYDGVIESYSQNVPIQFLWVSNITDFGNNLMEKTMFRLNVYATKQQDANFINIGYKTMRRLKQADETDTVRITDQIDLSNPNAFDEVNFLFYAISTFNEMGTSFPAKENNFLYIQFLVTGEGAIELNSIQTIYKNNRLLKTIG